MSYQRRPHADNYQADLRYCLDETLLQTKGRKGKPVLLYPAAARHRRTKNRSADVKGSPVKKNEELFF